MHRDCRFTPVLAGVVVVVVLAAAGCGGGGGSAPATTARAENTKAPDFTLMDMEGNPVRFSEIDSKVRVVDFWATWCAPCKEEIPMFKEIHAAYPADQVRVIAVSMDDSATEIVPPFLREHGIEYMNLIGDDDIYEAFGVRSLPTTYVIDTQGNIVKEYYGAVPKKVLVKQIEAVLEGGA